MTSYDLIPLSLLGLAFLGARRLDRIERERMYETLCRTSSTFSSPSASSPSREPTSEDASAYGPTRDGMRDPRFRYERGLP